MTIVTIPKSEYTKIIKTQNELKKRVDFLQKKLEEEVLDEVTPSYARKLERISAKMDKGNSVKFSSASKMKKYLNNL